MAEGDSKLHGTQLKGDTTKQKILELLLSDPKTTAEVAGILDIQKSAARVHLESLQAEGYVRSRFKIERLGRPKKVYQLTDHGRELFPRKYDVILNLLLKKIEEKDNEGHEEAKKLVESIADDIASSIRNKIEGKQSSGGLKSLEDELRILNTASSELGFVSSISKIEPKRSNTSGEKQGSHSKDTAFSIESRNCVLHKVALENQEIICHGLHDRIIKKSLGGSKSKVKVELRECMALGNDLCRHIVTSSEGNDASTSL